MQCLAPTVAAKNGIGHWDADCMVRSVHSCMFVNLEDYCQTPNEQLTPNFMVDYRRYVYPWLTNVAAYQKPYDGPNQWATCVHGESPQSINTPSLPLSVRSLSHFHLILKSRYHFGCFLIRFN